MKYLYSPWAVAFAMLLVFLSPTYAATDMEMNALASSPSAAADGFLGPDVQICRGDTLRIEAPLGISYLWSTGQTTQFITVTPLVSTEYWVRMINLQGTEQRDTLMVTVRPKPAVVINPAFTELLPGESVLLTAAGANSYVWNDGSTGHQFFAGPYLPQNTYTVTGSSVYGCTATAQAIVNVKYTTDPSFTSTKTCIGDSTFFEAKFVTNDTIQSIAWDLDGDLMFDDATGNLTAHLFESPGEWLVGIKVITKYQSLPHTIYLPVLVGDIPVLQITYTNPCIAANTTFSGNAMLSFGAVESWKWNFGNGQQSTQQNPVVSFDDNGQYTVSLETTTTAGCNAVLAKSVNVLPRPSLTISFADGSPIEQLPLTMFKNDTISLKANGIFDSVIWNQTIKRTLFDVVRPGNYRAVSYRNGCSSHTVTVGVVLSEFPYDPALKIPNILTPNGDGYNDTWEIPMLNSLRPAKVSIYSRAGLPVLQTTDYQNDWKGQYNNNPLPEGSYFYIVEGADGEIFKGTITLLR